MHDDDHLFFTADTHFGHENIIRYCDRPFETVEEMDAKIIENWNAVVRPTDTIWHLGDFTFGNAEMARGYFCQLNGIIKVLCNPWHHDSRWIKDNGGFVSKQGTPVSIEPPMVVLGFPKYGDGKYSKGLTLCHYPLAVWDRKHYGAWHLFGHSHGQHNNGGLSFDVGVDANDFRPISMAGVIRQMRVCEDETENA